jgi:microcystin-dependent protein
MKGSLTIIVLGIALCSAIVLIQPPDIQAEPFIGEIKWVAFNFAPRGWALCDGQLLPINQNQALFALLGTTFGGDGRTTFALPDMRGRTPIHVGQGPGLSQYVLGQEGGEESHTLTVSEIPWHDHPAMASNAEATAVSPAANVFAAKSRVPLYGPGPANIDMSASAIVAAGGSQPHNNMPPYITLNCVIALQGIFPSRN